MSQFDFWCLLIYGRRRQNKWLPQNSTSIVFQQCPNKVSFQRTGSSVVFKFLLNLLKGLQCSLFIREHFILFKKCSENLKDARFLSLKTYLILALLENKGSAAFEATTVAFSLP